MPLNLDTLKVLLFDLGGVIVPWVGIDALEKLTGLSRAQVTKHFSNNAILSAYEIGACDDDAFAEELNSIFNLGLSTSEIKDLWNSWVKPPFPNTEAVLKSLNKRYITACLSNTNSLHWTHLQTILDLDACFDMTFASQILKSAKPDPEIYQATIKALNVPPESILFFDDTMINVDAAQSAGLQAVHVDRTVGVIPKLREIGLI